MFGKLFFDFVQLNRSSKIKKKNVFTQSSPTVGFRNTSLDKKYTTTNSKITGTAELLTNIYEKLGCTFVTGTTKVC